MRDPAQYNGNGGPGKFDTMRLHSGGTRPSRLNRDSTAPIAARSGEGVTSASCENVSGPKTRCWVLAARLLTAIACSRAIGSSIVVPSSTSIALRSLLDVSLSSPLRTEIGTAATSDWPGTPPWASR